MTTTRSFDASSNGSILCAAHLVTFAKSQHDATWTFSFFVVCPQKRSLITMVRTMLLSLFPDL